MGSGVDGDANDDEEGGVTSEVTNSASGLRGSAAPRNAH